MEVGLGPDHIVFDGTGPTFRRMSFVAKRSPVSATAEHLLYFLRGIVHVEIQHLDYSCNNQLDFAKYHVVKTVAYMLEHSEPWLLEQNVTSVS